MKHAIKRPLPLGSSRAAVYVAAAVGTGLLGCSSGSPVVESRIEPGDASLAQGDASSGGLQLTDSGVLVDQDDTPIIELGPPEPTCGNGSLDEDEACDDGNTEGKDGCAADCSEIEEGYSCRNAGETCVRVTVCGDGRQTGAEQCDDANVEGGDGCSATCRIEADFACPVSGEACVSTVTCGDRKVSGPETCDDGNTEPNDGCDEHCQIEPGFVCSGAGARCQPKCGDEAVVGIEQCDDGNTTEGDGCSPTCKREYGYVCDGQGCRETVCGDGLAEGDEACDDGNDIHSGDGCSPGCVLEPVCTLPSSGVDATPDGGVNGRDGGLATSGQAGICLSSCGDGITLSGDEEECDDGNQVEGDGCDANCRIEEGWSCKLETEKLPDTLELPVVYRDFIHQTSEQGTSPKHPDFQSYTGGSSQMIYEPTLGLVEEWLGADGKPVYSGTCEAGTDMNPELCPFGAQMTSDDHFAQWYRDTEDVNIPVLGSIVLQRQGDIYVFDVESGLFPLDDMGWVSTAPPQEARYEDHNFGFTSELRYWFEFKGGEYLEFSGDDDVWVFIGGRLVVDLGGLHSRLTQSVTLDESTAEELGLVSGHVYELALFHAERRTDESNFKLSIGGFFASTTTCETKCGDNMVAGDEICDDGENNGAGYGFCTEQCTPGEHCGDGEVNGDEVCDNGVNLSGYLHDEIEGACAPGCVLPPHCGDGRLDSEFGEECDEGSENTGEYGGCNVDCTLASRCGDGEVDEEEECDDGNRSNADMCDVECRVRSVAEPR